MYNTFNKYKSSFVFLIKLVILTAAFYIIVSKLYSQSHLLIHFTNRNIPFLPFLIFTIFFSLLNWFIEITKWKLLVLTIKNISLFQASKQSLSALTTSLLTPNRIGEYGAKVLYYPKKYRTKILFLNLISNLSQMIATILFGLIGGAFLWTKLASNLKIIPSVFLIILFASMPILLFLVKKYNQEYWSKIISLIKITPISIYLKNQLLSISKYLIFSHQFYLLLLFFGIDLNYSTSMSIIFSMYFISSIIPSFVIFDWIIKGSIAVTLFHLFGINEVIILSITSLMWFLNFAIPSVIGSYFVLTFKSKNSNLKESFIQP